MSSVSVGNPAMKSAPEYHTGASAPQVAGERYRIRSRMTPLHPLEDEVVAGLQRQMQVRHQAFLRSERIHHTPASISMQSREDSRSRSRSLPLEGGRPQVLNEVRPREGLVHLQRRARPGRREVDGDRACEFGCPPSGPPPENFAIFGSADPCVIARHSTAWWNCGPLAARSLMRWAIAVVAAAVFGAAAGPCDADDVRPAGKAAVLYGFAGKQFAGSAVVVYRQRCFRPLGSRRKLLCGPTSKSQIPA
jgi:hypothetical protein